MISGFLRRNVVPAQKLRTMAACRRKTIKGIQSLRGGKREGAGRKAGVPNKSTADIKALAQQYTGAAMVELARLSVRAESETARVSAIKELLDRGYGKSREHVTVKDERDPNQWTDAELKAAIVADLGMAASSGNSGLPH